jgi:hypothetical protein
MLTRLSKRTEGNARRSGARPPALGAPLLRPSWWASPVPSPQPGRHACLVRKCSTRILEEGFRLFTALRTPFHLCFSFRQFWHEAHLKQPFLLWKDSAGTVAYNSWSSDSNERGRLSKFLWGPLFILICSTFETSSCKRFVQGSRVLRVVDDEIQLDP